MRTEDPLRPHWRWAYEQLHAFVLLMVNTGLRPDEAWRLEVRDVAIVKDHGSKGTILEISARGKRGVGYCKSMPGAVYPFRRLSKRLRPANGGGRRHRAQTGTVGDSNEAFTLPGLTHRLFPETHREPLNAILAEEILKQDHEGNVRTSYSLRHTYIRPCGRI